MALASAEAEVGTSDVGEGEMGREVMKREEKTRDSEWVERRREERTAVAVVGKEGGTVSEGVGRIEVRVMGVEKARVDATTSESELMTMTSERTSEREMKRMVEGVSVGVAVIRKGVRRV